PAPRWPTSCRQWKAWGRAASAARVGWRTGFVGRLRRAAAAAPEVRTYGRKLTHARGRAAIDGWLPMTNDRDDGEALLAPAWWVRNLARHLTRDAHTAEHLAH